MDMSFLLKSMLPPGVSIEMLQEQGLDVLRRVLSAADRIEQNHALLLEQNAILRHLITQCQPLAALNAASPPQEAENEPQTPAETQQVLQPDEPGHAGQRGDFPDGGTVYGIGPGNGDGGNASTGHDSING